MSRNEIQSEIERVYDWDTEIKPTLQHMAEEDRQNGVYRNLRNLLFYWSGSADWTPFNDCFKNGIKVTDIDGVVERNGYLLWLEVKQNGATIPKGQEWLFSSLQKLGMVTILILWGSNTDPEKVRVYPAGKMFCYDTKWDFSELHNRIARWYNFVDKKKPVWKADTPHKRTDPNRKDAIHARQREVAA